MISWPRKIADSRRARPIREVFVATRNRPRRRNSLENSRETILREQKSEVKKETGEFRASGKGGLIGQMISKKIPPFREGAGTVHPGAGKRAGRTINHPGNCDPRDRGSQNARGREKNSSFVRRPNYIQQTSTCFLRSSRYTEYYGTGAKSRAYERRAGSV